MKRSFEIQGHRGARARRPENTLPSFEAALDAGAASIETDLQLSGDGDIVLHHDSSLSRALCPQLREGQSVRLKTLSTTALRQLSVPGNSAPDRFPHQRADSMPLSSWFAQTHFAAPHDQYALPLLRNLFDFAQAYAGEAGAMHGKRQAQRENASRVILDLEIKNEPFEAHLTPKDVERIAESIAASGMINRCRARSFDHRLVRRIKQLLPNLETALLIAATVPLDPVQMVRNAGASIYCPDYGCLDEEQVKLLQAGGVRVLPWTVNEPEDWRKLIDWGVDGITTDDPARLAEFVLELR
jgi:glycerophosphoryl diester phosphodiesterase